MKKTMILVVVISFVFMGTLSADGLGYGAKAGLNMANFTGKDVSDEAKLKFGVTVGGFVRYSLSEKLSVRPEVLFTQKGSRYKESEGDYEMKEKVKMNWLDIPVLAVYQLADGITAFVGPYFDLYFGGEVAVKEEMGGQKEEYDYEIKGEDVNSLGLGLIFGGAYGVTENIDVEARVALGLTSLHEDFKSKNIGIQVIANYYLKK